MKRSKQNDVELLTFRKGDAVAMVVTDGRQTRSFTAHDCKAHGSIKMAIAYLESAGYEIVTDGWEG